MSDSKNLGYLGYSFQLKTLAQVLNDKAFAENIVPILDPAYFDDANCRLISKLLKEYHARYNTTPSYEVLDNIVRLEIKTEVQRKYVLDVLGEIKEQDLTDTEWTQERSFKFCKQQELKKAIKKAEVILEQGDFEKYDEIEGYIKEALSFGMDKDEAISVFDNLESVMVDNYRDTIPTGIEGLDSLFKGGVAKGEILVLLMAMGIGKTTMLTKIANSAFNFGANVLQIFFEDNINEIQRKHICCWTGVPLTEMNEETAKNATVKKCLSDLQKKPNRLLLQRWQSDSMTMTQIKNYVRKLRSDGVKLDMIIIDYIDCILPERDTENVSVDEGRTMRKFEAMCHELNLVGAVATQGNRSAISSELVTGDQTGGSIKKLQIGHIVISVAKTLPQKENGLANMVVLKSRVSKDGLVFENCIFNNERMEISTEQSETFLGFESNKSDRQKKRAIELYKERKEAANTVTNNQQPNNPQAQPNENLTDNRA